MSNLINIVDEAVVNECGNFFMQWFTLLYDVESHSIMIDSHFMFHSMAKEMVSDRYVGCI